jgi:hypothetical protein
MKDAEAAVRARDEDWLRQTSCIQAAGAMKVVLIDAPVAQTTVNIWRGRIYQTNGTPIDAYFDELAVVSFARGGVFKSEVDAEKVLRR